MNKATFVSEIPSKIEGNEVPTLSLVKSMIPEVVHEFVSSSDAGIEVILPEGSKFKVGAEIANSIPITIENCNRFVIKANDQTCEIDENTNLLRGVCGIQALDVNNSEHLSLLTNRVDKDYVLEFSNFKIDGLALDYTETITILSNGPTDMSSSRLMTANSVKGYVQDELSTYTHNHISTDTLDSIQVYTTEDIYINFHGDFLKQTEEGVSITNSDFKNCQFIYSIISTENLMGKIKYVKETTEQYILSSSILKDSALQGRVSQDSEGNYVFKLRNQYDISFNMDIRYAGLPFDSGFRFKISRGPTDMNSDQLMTANAVRGYVESVISSLQSTISDLQTRIDALEGKT